MPENERTPYLIKKQIKEYEFLYRKLEENNPLLIKVKKNEQEKRKLEQAKLEAKRKADNEKKKIKEEKLKAKRKADNEKKKLEEEKLEAKRKAEEEKKKLEEEKLEAKRKAEEEKKRLEEEKIKKQKALEERKLSLIPNKTTKEIAKKALIDIQKFIKNNPDEFDILEISEFFIKTKPIFENSFNEQLEKDLNSLIKFVQTSENFKSYLEEIEIKEREKNLVYIEEKLSLINEQIAIVTNFLYEELNSIHTENWLNSVKKAKQKLNNFNSLDEILVSSNELGTIISNQETLVKLNSESEKLILELKGYLAENLTTDLAPKILEQIENIKNSTVSENNNNIKIANEGANNFIYKSFLATKLEADKQKRLKIEKKKKEKEKKRNKDDISESNYAKKLLAFKDPSCGNYTFVQIFGDRLKNRKWTDLQHKNYMNIPFVKLEALDQKKNKEIVAILKMDPSDGSYELFEGSALGFSEQSITMTLLIMDEVTKKCF
jgi:hypothetical protein